MAARQPSIVWPIPMKSNNRAGYLLHHTAPVYAGPSSYQSTHDSGTSNDLESSSAITNAKPCCPSYVSVAAPPILSVYFVSRYLPDPLTLYSLLYQLPSCPSQDWTRGGGGLNRVRPLAFLQPRRSFRLLNLENSTSRGVPLISLMHGFSILGDGTRTPSAFSPPCLLGLR